LLGSLDVELQADISPGEKRINVAFLFPQVLESYSFDDLGEVSAAGEGKALQLVTHQGQRVVVPTARANQVKDLLNAYLVESASANGQYDYARALADFNSRDESALSFAKGDILAIAADRRDAYTEKGWLYGVKDGQFGLFPSDFVQRMSPAEVRREMRVIAKVTRPRSNRANSEEEDEATSTSASSDDEANKGRRSYREQDEGWRAGGDGDGGPPSLPRRRVGPNTVQELADDLSEVSLSEAQMAEAESANNKNPLLEFAMNHFRGSAGDNSQHETNTQTKKKGKKGKDKKKTSLGGESWTWKDQVDAVKWSDSVIQQSLLPLEPAELNAMAVECFACVMRYMGDLPLMENQHEVDCVNTVLMYCHRFEVIRDEVYCQIMKQTTSNRSEVKDSCQKGWRLFSIVAAYFSCSDALKPTLTKYLEAAAYDKRRACHGTALVCLHNLRKTFKYGGRKNVPGVEEITAISAGRSSKRQIYRLPGGTERVINTKSTTVVENVIGELCSVIGVDDPVEREEFSLYCIVEGETFTVPLAREHYVLDVTTELQRDGAVYYLIFCRSVW